MNESREDSDFDIFDLNGLTKKEKADIDVLDSSEDVSEITQEDDHNESSISEFQIEFEFPDNRKSHMNNTVGDQDIDDKPSKQSSNDEIDDWNNSQESDTNSDEQTIDSETTEEKPEEDLFPESLENTFIVLLYIRSNRYSRWRTYISIKRIGFRFI